MMGARVAQYTWEISPGVDTPLPPGEYGIAVFEEHTYRNLASRRKYTVREIDPESETLRYEYVRGDGERVQRTGPFYALSVVESVGDSPGGIWRRPEVVL